MNAAINVDEGNASVALLRWLACVLLMSGCAEIERSPQQPEEPVVASAGATASIVPSGASSALPAKHPPPTGTERRVVAPAPPVLHAAPAVPGAAAQVQTHPPAPTPKETTKTTSAPPPAAASQAPPALDLESLKTRLKETKAIGVFTKLALKNQIDELLDRFRAFYQGRLEISLAELRHSYDLLVTKVLALLQDVDPSLASAIASSRESIWRVLSDPAKFSAV